MAGEAAKRALDALEVVAGRRETLGPEHPDTLEAVDLLARLLANAGDDAENTPGATASRSPGKPE